MTDYSEDDIEACDNDDWWLETTKPYTNARRKLSESTGRGLALQDIISSLSSAEDDFWSFICEYDLNKEDITRVFNIYLEETRRLRMREWVNTEDASDIIIRCLGLGFVMLADMERIYKATYGSEP
jgi:hypothetical protein